MTIRGKVISFQVFRFDATAPSTLIGEHDAAMVPSADRACGADRQANGVPLSAALIKQLDAVAGSLGIAALSARS